MSNRTLPGTHPDAIAALQRSGDLERLEATLKEVLETLTASAAEEIHPSLQHLPAFERMLQLQPGELRKRDAHDPLAMAGRVFECLIDAALRVQQADDSDRCHAARVAIEKLHAATEQDLVRRRGFVGWLLRCAEAIRGGNSASVVTAVFLQFAGRDHDSVFSKDLGEEFFRFAKVELVGLAKQPKSRGIAAAARLSCGARAFGDGGEGARTFEQAKGRFKSALEKGHADP